MGRSHGFARTLGAATTQCALCEHTRMEHHLGAAGTTRHTFVTLRDFKQLDPIEQLRLSTQYADAEHALPRCVHGKALRDHAGDLLEPSCGCRIHDGRMAQAGSTVFRIAHTGKPGLYVGLIKRGAKIVWRCPHTHVNRDADTNTHTAARRCADRVLSAFQDPDKSRRFLEALQAGAPFQFRNDLEAHLHRQSIAQLEWAIAIADALRVELADPVQTEVSDPKNLRGARDADGEPGNVSE